MTDNDRVLYMIKERIHKEVGRLQSLERNEINETRVIDGYNDAGGYNTEYEQLDELRQIVDDIETMLE